MNGMNSTELPDNCKPNLQVFDTTNYVSRTLSVLAGEFSVGAFMFVPNVSMARIALDVGDKQFIVDVPLATAINFTALRAVVFERFGVLLRSKLFENCEPRARRSECWLYAIAEAAVRSHGNSDEQLRSAGSQ